MVAGMLFARPALSSARSVTDSLLMTRIYNYRRNFTHDLSGHTTNVYSRQTMTIKKRNSLLWPIPTMYSVAKGSKEHMLESYKRLRFESADKCQELQHVLVTTIRHNRKTLPTLEDFITPNLYDMVIFRDHMLSPFHRKNRYFYKYGIIIRSDGSTVLRFRPRFTDNTQLVTGEATVDFNTGRIIRVEMKGEYDMIRFRAMLNMGDDDTRSLLPKSSRTEVDFKFLGNHIMLYYEATYDCPQSLPDTLVNSHDRKLIEKLRPYPLTIEQTMIYNDYDREHPAAPPDTTHRDTTDSKHTTLIDFLHHDIGDNLVTSIRAKTENISFKLSPIINPQYLSYSRRHGLAYKMKLGVKYYFNAHRFFDFYPNWGYNFKFKQFYFTAPLRFNYNPKRDGYVEVTVGNGNRITNSSVIEEIQREKGDTVHLENMDFFKDDYVKLSNNIMAFDWIDIETGLTLHRRKAINPEEMLRHHKPPEYRSFAPLLTLKLRPWKEGPLFTIDYERGIKGINKSNIGYERWEIDGSIKYHLHLMRKLNLRVGGGWYSKKEDNYFVDFANFRDNNLPEGWDDDWTGNFQLLRSRWYNESSYYARTNLSYESPFLATSWLPLIGRFIETERFYLSALSIEHTRPYYEIGYGLTTRAVSIGVFTGFLGTQYYDFGCKFTFELFRRW